MEQKSDVILTVVDTAPPSTQLALSQNQKQTIDIDDDTNTNNVADQKNKKKKRGGINILKVALFLLRRKSGKSTAVDVAASNGKWKQLVGSMRPLHLQSNTSDPDRNALPPPPPPPVVYPLPPSMQSPIRENFEDVFSPPFSPQAPKSSSSSSVDGMSRYASAVNLQELDEADDDDEDDDNNSDDECANMNGGDEMIDAKADVFIAQFYQQMRLQRSDYNNMIKRSIG